MDHSVYVLRQVGEEGFQSHVRGQLSIHLQSVCQRLQFLESQLEVCRTQQLPPRAEYSVMAKMERLERQLMELQSTMSTASAASDVPPSAASTGLDEIASDLSVYEKVLQVLSAETNKLLDQMKTSEDYRQQHKTMMDSLHSRVNDVFTSLISSHLISSHLNWTHLARLACLPNGLYVALAVFLYF